MDLPLMVAWAANPVWVQAAAVLERPLAGNISLNPCMNYVYTLFGLGVVGLVGLGYGVGLERENATRTLKGLAWLATVGTVWEGALVQVALVLHVACLLERVGEIPSRRRVGAAERWQALMNMVVRPQWLHALAVVGLACMVVVQGVEGSPWPAVRQGWEVAMANPWLGVGMGASDGALAMMARAGQGELGMAPWVRVLMDVGFPVAILAGVLVLVMLAMFVRGMRLRRRGVVYPALGVAMMGLSLWWLVRGGAPVWMVGVVGPVVGMALAQSMPQRSESAGWPRVWMIGLLAGCMALAGFGAWMMPRGKIGALEDVLAANPMWSGGWMDLSEQKEKAGDMQGAVPPLVMSLLVAPWDATLARARMPLTARLYPVMNPDDRDLVDSLWVEGWLADAAGMWAVVKGDVAMVSVLARAIQGNMAAMQLWEGVTGEAYPLPPDTM
ncbi:MAG: hypothetical protein WAZ18_02720 [Alphaproteobacteria bacterium]